MSLESDKFDPTEMLERLTWSARHILGSVGWRQCGPEVTDFIQNEVHAALLRAFSRAEALYINKMVSQGEERSRLMLESVFAGAELARRESERD